MTKMGCERHEKKNVGSFCHDKTSYVVVVIIIYLFF